MRSMLLKTYPKYFAQFNGFKCLLQTIKMQLFISYCDMFTNLFVCLFVFVIPVCKQKNKKTNVIYTKQL